MYGGLSASPEPRERESTDDGEGPSKVKTRLVRRLSASSAMIAAAPVDAPAENYLTYIEHIPPEDGPQMFGMHASVRTRVGENRHPYFSDAEMEFVVCSRSCRASILVARWAQHASFVFMSKYEPTCCAKRKGGKKESKVACIPFGFPALVPSNNVRQPSRASASLPFRPLQADISLRLKESKALLDAVLSLQPRDANASAGQRPDDVVLAVTQELVSKIPGSLKHRKVQ